MNIVSLAPSLTELVYHFDQEPDLKGVSFACDYPDEAAKLSRVTSSAKADSKQGPVISANSVDFDLLASLEPDIVLTSLKNDEDPFKLPEGLEQELQDRIGREVRLRSYYPRTLDEIYETFNLVSKHLGAGDRGKVLTQLLKAQVMDWGDNFYERMKNKKVTFLSNVDPFILGGLWIPDMIHLASAHSQVRIAGKETKPVEWLEIVNFRPDVIIVAPCGFSIEESIRTFKTLVKLPHWDDIPAVKRGEVIFTSGHGFFHRPGPRLRESMGILISAIAGLESGYITKRDSFHRLRYVELQRHRFE